MGNHPVEEAEKMKCYKRLTYKQFIQVSGLCGPQFLSYLPKRFTHPCRALYGDAILMYRFGAPIWRPEINKNIWGSLFLLKLFPFTRKLAYVGINISFNTWNGYIAENQEERLFFNETAILFSCHALWKRGSSNYCVQNKTCYGNGNLYKDLFFVFPQSGVNKLILAILTLQFDDVAVKTTYWFVMTELTNW